MITRDGDSLRIVAGVALAAYGIYTALYVPPLLMDHNATLLFVLFLAVAVTSLVAAVALFRAAPWAPAALMLWAAAVVATQLVEGPVLGLIANLRAIGGAVLAILLALAIAALPRRTPA